MIDKYDVKDNVKMGHEIGRLNADIMSEADGLNEDIELEKSPEDLYIDAMID